ncbi:acyl-CoA transferase [Halomonas eurihalina]|uniref:Acyl-CoA transferase n=1 Tax=Halomonas eurihalina TaxID=42566 RepID=A0A5D9DBC1_HALER|nr:CoA transferase [Halomonas eurihalina]MDR5859277.1 CoA transferase [Halomonas eurihalina]TZG40899.1 acyl-CoA transferase [Halomonas eurihalina]
MYEFYDREITYSLGAEQASGVKTVLSGSFSLSSVFTVSELAMATIVAAAKELAALVGKTTVSVDRFATELWCSSTIRPEGWALPNPWDPVAGNYRTADGWIRLHTNVPAHLAAALRVLGTKPERSQVAAATLAWSGRELEQAVNDAGGVAAHMVGLSEWAAHPQGEAVAAEPLISWSPHHATSTRLPSFQGNLCGLRVLDLTRVLAGPVATRFLAGFGAEVLRIDPPDWAEDGLEPEVTIGKRCAGLDLRNPEDRDRFEMLLAQAHVLVHGYRPGALDGLGYDAMRRRQINPSLVDVSLSAYGWTGPWHTRRGFDSVLQVKTGLAQEAMHRTGANCPVALPVQVLDHGTGYLMAAAVLRALRLLVTDGKPRSARLSLARTAQLLIEGGVRDTIIKPTHNTHITCLPETTHWGPARRIDFPVKLDCEGPRWRYQAAPFRSAQAYWPDDVNRIGIPGRSKP